MPNRPRFNHQIIAVWIAIPTFGIAFWVSFGYAIAHFLRVRGR